MANYNGTLCWQCSRSIVDQCCWAFEGKPVPGWNAIRRDIGAKGGGVVEESYIVCDCPDFIPDKGVKALRDPKQLDTNGCISLLEKLLKICREDYINIPKTRAEIRWFLEGNEYMLKTLDDAVAENEKQKKKAERERRRMRVP